MTETASPRMHDAPSWLRVDPEVAAALATGRPVVALESAVITHGLPRPVNLEIARYMETEILSAGAQPAIVALLDGEICLGLSSQALERLALADRASKISRRDLGIVSVRGGIGGTTVAATMIVAHAAGVKIFATGGIGGVHLGSSGDVSADLPELSRTPVAVVCSGAKAILDLPRTLEWLETAGVPIIGWRTDEFPAFFSHGSGLSVNVRADTPAEVANILRSHWGMNLESGVLICVPCPEDVSVPFEIVEQALDQAEAEAKSSGIAGKDLTPFLLNRLSELSNGATLRANLALLRNNARVAAAIAKSMS
jgi:pseudouridine-5'-phosphate glycosidase